MHYQPERFVSDRTAVIRFPVLNSELIHGISIAEGEGLRDLLIGLIDDKYVDEALYLASPGLHKRMRAWKQGGGDFGDIPYAIARYLLRMAFRSTPFGTFSCISYCDVSGSSTEIAIPERAGMVRRVDLDTTALNEMVEIALSDDQVRRHVSFYLNDTICINDETITFVAFSRSKSGKRIFRRIELDRSEHLDMIIDVVAGGSTLSELKNRMCSEFPQEQEEDVIDFLNELIEQQVICADQLADITNPDPLGHLVAALPEDAPAAILAREANRRISALSGQHAVDASIEYEDLSQLLSRAGVKLDRSSSTKVDLYLPEGVGSLGDDVISILEKTIPEVIVATKRNSFNNFIRLFEERFGESEVPLQVVEDELDSLGFVERQASQPGLVLRARADRASKTPASAQQRDLTRMLAERSISSCKERYIDIKSLSGMSDNDNLRALGGARSLVAWISLWQKEESSDGSPIVELKSVGAQEPGRVMGRFASGVPEVARYLRATAAMTALPVVEIVHPPTDRLGNICARPMLSDYALRIRAGGGNSTNNLSLADLTIRVSHGRILVRSATLNSDIELRMSNAHAFDRKDSLPIYRFLNHLCFQDAGIQLQSLRSNFPLASYVPGIKHGEVIVTRPSWRISVDDLSRYSKSSRKEQRENLVKISKEMEIPDLVSISNGDNVIPLRLSTAWMADIIIKEVVKSGQVILTEAAPAGCVPYIKSDMGRHNHEIQIALRVPEQRASKSTKPASSYLKAVQNPWGSWCYWQLQSPARHQNKVISELRVVLDQASTRRDGFEYFFIRYRDEHGPHLRLRVRCENAIETTASILRPTLESLSARRLVHSAAIVPYIRESVRYGGDEACEFAESIFCRDSSAALDVLEAFDQSGVGNWKIAAAGMDAMMIALGVKSLKDRLSFASRAAAEFSAELGFGSVQRVAIGKILKSSPPLDLQRDGTFEKSVPSAMPFYQASSEISKLWESLLGELRDRSAETVFSIRWSLIHMRMNRLFDDSPRLQEAIVWELLKRSYLGASARIADRKEELCD